MCCGSHPVCIRGGLLARFSSIDFTGNGGRVGFVSTAIALMYTKFKSDVAQIGVDDEARSEGIWRRRDIDRSHMIDIKEFLYMLYLWQYAMDVSGTNSSQSNAPTGGYGQDCIKANKTQLYSALAGQALCNPASSPRSFARMA